LADPFNDGHAFVQRARGNVDVAQLDIVLRALMRNDLPHTASADDQNVFLHFAQSLPPRTTATLRLISLPDSRHGLAPMSAAMPSRCTCSYAGSENETGTSVSTFPISRRPRCPSRKTAYIVVKTERLHQFIAPVEAPDHDGWHVHAVEPVLLDH